MDYTHTARLCDAETFDLRFLDVSRARVEVDADQRDGALVGAVGVGIAFVANLAKGGGCRPIVLELKHVNSFWRLDDRIGIAARAP